MLGHRLALDLSNKIEIGATFRQIPLKLAHLPQFKKIKVFENINAENIEGVKTVIDEFKPSAVINCIGIIKQIADAKNAEKAIAVNALFPHQIANFCGERGIKFIGISTDCVFSGRDGDYTEESFSDAEDLYGRTKFLGEVAGKNALTLRTSIIGHEIGTAHSLIDWFLANRGGSVRGFTEAIYTGFPTAIMSKIIADVLEKQSELHGVYQVSSEKIDKFSLLKIVNEVYGADINIIPSDELKIDRSLNSDKFRQVTGFTPLGWREMIEIMARDREFYEK